MLAALAGRVSATASEAARTAVVCMEAIRGAVVLEACVGRLAVEGSPTEAGVAAGHKQTVSGGAGRVALQAETSRQTCRAGRTS